MRDPKRIPRIIDALRAAWEAHPDWRLGQLIVNCIEPRPIAPTVFYPDDDVTERGLDVLLSQVDQIAGKSQGILATCENGHEQRIYTPHMSRQEAVDFAAMLDGTSPMFAHSPRTDPLPGSRLGRCGYCSTWFDCTLFGYPDPGPLDHEYVPSAARGDSCDQTDWSTWLVCDRPEASHARHKQLVDADVETLRHSVAQKDSEIVWLRTALLDISLAGTYSDPALLADAARKALAGAKANYV